MQTTSTLPIQVTGAGQANAAQRANNGNGNGNAGASQFSATLSREMDQRRQLPPAVAQQPAAKPQQPARSQQADKPAAKQAETNRAAAQDEARPDDSTVAKADAETEEDTTDTASQGAADEPSNPVADMLALVASFNQSMRKAAPAEAAPADTRGASADAGQLTALQAATKRFTADVADSGKPAVQQDPLDAAQPRATLADALGTAQPKAAPDGADALAFAPAFEAASKRAAAGADAAQLRDAALNIEEVKAPAPQVPLAVQAQATAALEAAKAANPAGEHIPARVGTPGWDNQVGQKIVWMVAGGDQSAELTLNPPDLGPMQVVLSVSGDQASVTFSSNQMEVRQALENALPRLRDMMSESGIALGNATVNSGSDQRQAQDGQAGSGNGGGARFAGNGDNGDTETARPAARTTVLGDRGMVDTFA